MSDNDYKEPGDPEGVFRDSKGRFLPGSKVGALRKSETLKKRIKIARGNLKDALLWVGELTLGEFKALTKNTAARDNLTMSQGIALQYYSQVLQSNKTAHFESLTGFLGISTKVSANVEDKRVADEGDSDDDNKKLVEVKFIEPGMLKDINNPDEDL